MKQLFFLFLSLFFLQLPSLYAQSNVVPKNLAQPIEDSSTVIIKYDIKGIPYPSDSLDSISKSLNHIVPLGSPWNIQNKELIESSLRYKLLYDIVISQRSHNNETIVFISLQPSIVIQNIEIHINNTQKMIRSTRGKLIFRNQDSIEEIFSEAILERDINNSTGLHVNSFLPQSLKQRNSLLTQRKQRLLSHFHSEGFFDARASILHSVDKHYKASITIIINPGRPYSFNNIVIKGNKSISSQQIRSLFAHKALGFFTLRFREKHLKQSIAEIKKLYQDNNLPEVIIKTDYNETNINRDTKKINIVVFVTEKSNYNIVIQGNKKIEDNEILSLLTLRKQNMPSKFEIERSAKKIKRHYRDKRYLNAVVSWDRNKTTQQNSTIEQVVFSIDEGPLFHVNKIQFYGNKTFSQQSIESMINANIKQQFNNKSTTLKTQLVETAQKITEAYHIKGFADVKITYKTEMVEDVSDGINVNFNIDEGIVSHVSAVYIKFKQDSIYTHQTLLKRLSLFATRKYQKTLLIKDKSTLQNFYLDRGYPHIKINSFIEKSTSNKGAIIVTHEIDRGIFVQIGNIFFRGNFKTNLWVLKELFSLKSQDVFSLKNINNAQYTLRSSGLFKRITLQFIGLKSQKHNRVDIIVNVEERFNYARDYTFSAVFSTDYGFFSDAVISWPNLFGVGIETELKAQLGQKTEIYEAKITLPTWLIRQTFNPFNFRVQGVAFYYVEDTLKFGELKNQGFQFIGSQRGTIGTFWEDYSGNLYYNFKLRNRNLDLIQIAGVEDQLKQAPIPTITGTLGGEIALERRRDSKGAINPLLPVRGYWLKTILEFADPSLSFYRGIDTFIKFGLRGQHLFVIGQDITIANSVRYDHGIPLYGATILPEVERFFGGGDNTVRGLKQDHLLTKVIETPLAFTNGATQLSIRPEGGNIRFIHNFDVQFKIIDSLPWISNVLSTALSSGFFVDTGFITNNFLLLNLSDIRYSTGLSSRLTTDFFAVSFEWGIPINPKIGDDPRGRFHLNLGFLY